MPRKMILVWISVHFYNVKHTTMIAKHVARSISRDFEFVNCASFKKKTQLLAPGVLLFIDPPNLKLFSNKTVNKTAF